MSLVVRESRDTLVALREHGPVVPWEGRTDTDESSLPKQLIVRGKVLGEEREGSETDQGSLVFISLVTEGWYEGRDLS